MSCSCPGDGVWGGAGRCRGGLRGRWPRRWPDVPLHALLVVLVLVSVPTSPAPFQGDPAPGRSPGPPGRPPGPPGAPPAPPTSASPSGGTPLAGGNVTTATPPTGTVPSAPASATSEQEEAWCTGYASMGRPVDAPQHHAVNLSLSHGLYLPGHGLVAGVKYRGKSRPAWNGKRGKLLDQPPRPGPAGPMRRDACGTTHRPAGRGRAGAPARRRVGPPAMHGCLAGLPSTHFAGAFSPTPDFISNFIYFCAMHTSSS